MAQRILQELQIRTIGYLPRYDKNQFDQHGYSREDKDRDGRGRDGLTDDERNQDPADRPPQGQATPITIRKPIRKEVRYARHGDIDRRRYNKGVLKNKANVNGQIVRAEDGSDRTMDQAWFDTFATNEMLPPIDRITDEQILAKMKECFPRRKFREAGRQTGAVTYNRWRYNMGKLACQKNEAPAYLSYRYIRDGALVMRVTVRGKCLEQWNFTEVYKGRKMRREPDSPVPSQQPPPDDDNNALP